MKDEQWERVCEVLDPALEMEAGERREFAGKACGDDLKLLNDVLAYIAAYEHEEILPLPSPAESGIDIPDLCNVRLGSYRLVRVIGRGGMGEVYEAERVDGVFEKSVAVKVLRWGGGGDAFYDRWFDAERRILSRIDHPYIVRLIDGGATPDGNPYLVMDYIKGISISKYCREQKLGTDATLTLFLKICEAIAYAHRNLIIHSDIKPANVLVTDAGEPKLLDFGVARLLSREFAESDSHIARAFTPRYASPEQIAGKDVTVATDVYSLGILLYELLVGRTPFRRNGALSHDVLDSECNKSPEPPSHALHSLGRDDAARRLRGDLDSIVLKALAHEPEQRYTSVEQFASDIQAYLSARPVIARKPTLWYLGHKFILRNRWGVAAAALVTASLIGGVAATTWQASIAQHRFAQVRKLAGSLVFELEPTLKNVAGATLARKILIKEALEYLDALVKDAGGDPSLQKEIATTYERLGDVQGNSNYSNLGDIQGALESYQSALSIRRHLVSAKPTDGQLQDELATCLKGLGRILEMTDSTAEELRAYREALAIWQGLLAAKPSDASLLYKFFSVQDRIGRTLLNAGDTFRAGAYFRQELTIIQKLLQIDPQNTQFMLGLWFAHRHLGQLATERGDATLALDHHNQGLKTIEQLSALEPENALFKRYLAVGYQDVADALGNPESVNLGDWKGALSHYQETLRIDTYLGKIDPDNAEAQREMSIVQERIGEVLTELGRTNEALGHFVATLEIRLKLANLDKKNLDARLDLAYTYHNVGRILLLKGDAVGALKNLQKALSIREKATDLETKRGLAETLLKLGEAHEQLAAHVRGVRAAQHWHIAAGYYQRVLALLSSLQGRQSRGIPFIRLLPTASQGMTRCTTALRHLNKEDTIVSTALTRQTH
jgi:eukaryotic-like serine/threonine-protein kinase